MNARLNELVCALPFQALKPHSEPTQTVDLQNPDALVMAIDVVMCDRFGGAYGLPLLEQGIADLARAFRGDYPHVRLRLPPVQSDSS